MAQNNRNNYVAIAYDGAVRFVGTNKEGRRYYYSAMGFAHGFSGTPYSYNAQAMAEHAIETHFFARKAQAMEWAQNYSLTNPSDELQTVTAIAAIAQALSA